MGVPAVARPLRGQGMVRFARRGKGHGGNGERGGVGRNVLIPKVLADAEGKAPKHAVTSESGMCPSLFVPPDADTMYAFLFSNRPSGPVAEYRNVLPGNAICSVKNGQWSHLQLKIAMLSNIGFT